MDATTNTKLNSCGFGMVIHDWRGEMVLYKTIHWPFPLSAVAAEAMTIKWGLNMAVVAVYPNSILFLIVVLLSIFRRVRERFLVTIGLSLMKLLKWL